MTVLTGRPTDYTEELANDICRRIAGGGNLLRICAEDEMPSRDTVYRWLEIYTSFSDNYARARERRADSRSDRMDDYRERMIDGELDPNAVRVAMQAEQWQAAREAPKRYGDKYEATLDLSLKVELMRYAAEGQEIIEATTRPQLQRRST